MRSAQLCLALLCVVRYSNEAGAETQVVQQADGLYVKTFPSRLLEVCATRVLACLLPGMRLACTPHVCLLGCCSCA